MYLAKNLSTDPYFNMAAEEYLLDCFKGDIILLWRNDKTVVVGKNQNTAEEVDASFVEENGIAVVRRLSGGGAVFHDLGNINFTVIEAFQDELFSNYDYFTKPVCQFLQTLGVEAELSGRNDLLLDGMKFCGNAQTRRSGKIMHHGCILFAADVADLSGALTPSKLKIESKSVKSVRSRITNVASHLETKLTPEAFFDGLYDYFQASIEGIEEYRFTEEDKEAISRLADEKYRTWEWNFGSSPDFQGGNSKRFDFGIVDIRFCVKEGRLGDVKLYGDFFGIRDVEELEKALKDAAYSRTGLAAALAEIPLEDYINGMTKEDLTKLLLG